ncbi:MAG: glycosyltransferase family 39 protein [Deltaproteobacteria bacterium]|nr:glycosyltransferase family 39 protein [Deltaproteobacteria bacterium]
MQFRWGVPVGIVAVALAAWGALDLAGTFDDPDDRVAHRFKIGEVGTQLGAVVGTLVLTIVLITMAVAGYTNVITNAVLITASFLALVVSVYRLGEKLGAWGMDDDGKRRAMFQRHGFWVVVAGTVLYLPMQGSYSLSDPWETHYGEVAREILARDDWISTWWAQDGWFWSKPVLNFWTEALSMALFGAGWKPDQMLAAAGRGLNPWPEWAIRMPVFILTIVALYLLYKGVAKVFGRRAGLLGALVLATMPHWFFLSHQTMTDMPFVAAMTSSMGLLLLGLHSDPNKEVRVYEIDLGFTRFRVSGFHLVFGAILMAVIPQILYLITRNVDLQLAATPHGFRWHSNDVFSSGSGLGNCVLQGNQACAETPAANKDMLPAYQGALWAGILILSMWINRGERRISRLYFLLAWFFAAVSTMGKGPAGFALPMLCAGAYIFATGKWKKLLEIEIMSGLLIIACVALPWYVAMYMRHGQPFTDRLLFHDMWKRALTHVHDTNVGDDVSFRFFVWQLGYAFFPWTGLVPAGLVWWARRRDDAKGGQGDVALFLAMWFIFAFALFTAMLTKFHHYIFPAVPPAAMLTGVVLDHMIGKRQLAGEGKWTLLKYLGSVAAGVGLTIYGFFRLFPGRLMGNVEADTMAARPAMVALGIPCILVGIAVVIAGVRFFGARRPDAELPDEDDDEAREEPKGLETPYRGDEPAPKPKEPGFVYQEILLGGVGIAAAVVVALCGRDLASKPKGDVNGQARLLHLFTYNYGRQWPDSLDFSGMLSAFALVATGLMVLLMFRRFRQHVVVATLSMAGLWGLWALDIYMVKTAPHWGQRETIMAYYKDRASPSHPIVAYQMNWKGENFYTGNKIPAFVSSGAKFTQWVTDERAKGVKTMYFVTEHGRRNGLKNELGTGVRSFEPITSTWLDNKFGLFKAVFD